MKKALTFLEIRKLNEKNRIEKRILFFRTEQHHYSKDEVCWLQECDYFCIKECYKKLKLEYPNDHFIHIRKAHGKPDDYIRFYTVSLMKKIKWKLCPRKFFKI